MPEVPEISHASLQARRGRCFHAGRSVAQADLYEMEWEGRPALLKDFSARPWLVRRFWGRAIAAREIRALRRLSGIEGIPRLYAVAGPEAFVMERLDADRMPQKKETPPPLIFWQNARRMMDQLHERGVGHGDLRRKNILIGPRGEAYLIDFATAFFRKDAPGLSGKISEIIFQRYQSVDRVTFARIKASYGNAPLAPDEQAWLDTQPWYLTIPRLLKKRFYRLRKPRWWRDRTHKLWRWVRQKFSGTPSDGAK
jgi:tRNA A-37 threonylcarbamoyl transferase component Bud32